MNLTDIMFSEIKQDTKDDSICMKFKNSKSDL